LVRRVGAELRLEAGRSFGADETRPFRSGPLVLALPVVAVAMAMG